MHRGLPLILLLPLLLLAAYVFHRNPRSARAQSTSTSCCSQTDVAAPREIDFPYYSLRDGFTSTLHLVNVSPTAIDLTIAIHSLSGQTLLAPIVTMNAEEKRSLDLGSLLTQLSADVTGAFAEGSVSIYFTGTIMPIAGQLTMTNPIQRMGFETEMVDNSPGLFLLPKQLNGLWWGLGSGRDARVMVANTSGASASADVYLDFQGQRQTSAPLFFAPHETKVLSIVQLLGALNVSPAAAPEGGITIMPRDVTPTLIAQGRITDPVTGFSTTLNFPDPSLELSSSLHASGVPIGTPTADSPYAGAGTFVPHVLVRNLLGVSQNVTISVEYPQPPATSPSTSSTAPGAGTSPTSHADGDVKVIPRPPLPGDSDNHPEWGAGAGATVGTVTLPSLPVGAYSTIDYSLATVIGQLPSALPHASIRIQYSGPPGSALAEVASIEAKGDLVVDGRLANEGNGWAGSGAHPWHLDSNTESILFLTNESGQNCRIGFRVDALGKAYFLTKLTLTPHETRAINLRELRDAQTADFKGDLIPANASDGSVDWIRLDNLPVMGRLLVLRRNQGMASSYQCTYCPCAASYEGLSVSPLAAALGVDSSYGYLSNAEYGGCVATYYSDVTTSAGWTSDNTPVATVNNSTSKGLVTGVAAGTANITASYTGVTYVYANPYCEVSGVPTDNGSGTADIYNVQVTSVSLPSDQVKVTLNGPSGASGQLVVTWNGPSGNANIASATEGPGSYTFNPSLSNLVTGQYTGVTAQWTLNGTSPTGTYTINFDVLGSYRQSQYNTPAESQCSGNSATAYLTTGPTSCPWSTVSLISNFIVQAWINGSGSSANYGLIQEYLNGCSPPPGGNNNYFREVSSVVPGCSSPNNYLSNTTLAVDVLSQGHPLSCGDSVLIVGMGSGVGTVKAVTDSCPACKGLAQIDNYNTSSACSLSTLPSCMSIRINR